MALLTFLASLFGCSTKDSFILDGPGMVYVDSDYRTEYANCLPFEDMRGAPYFAICYLGSGSEGEANKDACIAKIFGSLNEEARQKIQTYDFQGDAWYLVIPKYRSSVNLKNGDAALQVAAYQGEAFVVRCDQNIVVNTFESTEINYTLSTDENGKLQSTGENVWDITDIDEILKQ